MWEEEDKNGDGYIDWSEFTGAKGEHPQEGRRLHEGAGEGEGQLIGDGGADGDAGKDEL